MVSSIRFFYEVDGFTVPHPIRLRRWLRAVAQQEGRSVNELRYIFCSDEYLHRMNVEYLNHDTLTDIITFDTSEEEGRLAGEIYISLERVTENAQTFSVPVEQELARVMVHGVLHLCGHLDERSSEIQKMRFLENFYLSQRTPHY